MNIKDKLFKMKETVDYLEEIKSIWKDNEEELSWELIKEIEKSIKELKSDIEDAEDEIKWEEHKKTKEYAEGLYWDAEIDAALGK